MLQDIAPHIYRNQMSWKEPDADDFVLCYRGRTLYCKVESRNLILPRVKDVPADALQYAFSIDERADYLLSDAEFEETDGFSYLDTGKLRSLALGPALMAAAAGESLYRWYSSQRFCGRCGKPMEKSKIERAMVCPACGNTVYPKICPAVIVAIHDGDRLVLTRYKDRPFKNYALVAGFNEIGESIEETVHREVLEETGLRVKNLRFYKSQPWVFTDTLLFGFFAELDGSDDIAVEEDELVFPQRNTGGSEPYQPDGRDDGAVPERTGINERRRTHPKRARTGRRGGAAEAAPAGRPPKDLPAARGRISGVSGIPADFRRAGADRLADG